MRRCVKATEVRRNRREREEDHSPECGVQILLKLMGVYFSLLQYCSYFFSLVCLDFMFLCCINRWKGELKIPKIFSGIWWENGGTAQGRD